MASEFFNDSSPYAIVADIGGTNARFSRVDLNNLQVDKVAVYTCADFPALTDALTFYQQVEGLTGLKHAAIAIACPVNSDLIRMTNFHWQFSVNEVKQELGLQHLQVMNDFIAQAMSLPKLSENDKIKIGSGFCNPRQSMVVLGAGTGLGVAHLIPTAEGYLPLASEGGHTDWSAQNEQEWFIHRFLNRLYGHVSPERILSGSGLENLYLAIAAYHHQTVRPISAAEISFLALQDKAGIAKEAVLQFFASLGSYAGDLALTLSTFGGVYIAGGIVPKLLPLIEESEFRQRFEAKGRFTDFNRKIATYVVTAEQPGLLGAAAYLKQMMREHYGIC